MILQKHLSTGLHRLTIHRTNDIERRVEISGRLFGYVHCSRLAVGSGDNYRQSPDLALPKKYIGNSADAEIPSLQISPISVCTIMHCNNLQIVNEGEIDPVDLSVSIVGRVAVPMKFNPALCGPWSRLRDFPRLPVTGHSENKQIGTVVVSGHVQTYGFWSFHTLN